MGRSFVAPLQSELQLLDELGGLAQVLGLVALSVRHTARQAVCSPGRCLQGLSQGTDAVVDVALSPGMFIRDTSGSLPVELPRPLGVPWLCA